MFKYLPTQVVVVYPRHVDAQGLPLNSISQFKPAIA